MELRKRIYEAKTLNVNGVKIKVYVLKDSTTFKDKKTFNKDLMDTMEKMDALEDVLVEYVQGASDSRIERVVLGKTRSPTLLAKWPTKLFKVAILEDSAKEVNLTSLKWIEAPKNAYVYEGMVEGSYYAVLLDTEDGIYTLFKETREEGHEENYAENEGEGEGEGRERRRKGT